MNRIIDKKSSGKTGRLFLLAKENNGVVVCANPTAMREKAYGYGITGIDFISYEEYLYPLSEAYDTSKPVYIDELEKMLIAYDSMIAGYSLSEE